MEMKRDATSGDATCPVTYTMPSYVDISSHAIHDYFTQLNPIATRIAYDINETKSTYGYLWDTLHYNEQNDIINDTLIKPEISLRYFNDFVKTADPNILTKIPHSTNSLAAVVLENINKCDSAVKISALEVGEHLNEDRELKVEAKFGCDGRSLRTYAVQEVALKLVHDDNSSLFHDEHSHPFSYRTKSQINLELMDGSSTYYKGPKIINNFNIRYLSCNVANSGKHLCNLKAHDIIPISCMKPNISDLKNSSTKSKLNTLVFSYNNKCTDKMNSNNLDLEIESDKRISRSKGSSGQMYLNSTSKEAVSPSISYMVYSDDLYGNEESSNLMQPYDKISNFVESLSASTSDDDELIPNDHNTDGNSDEGSKLLDRGITMRKGFEFLNNW
uniref:DUF4706 domain-containing protein n=1 Tax=Glossina brevipalpis TaxID=37001 RepID=A0A1A9WYB7_9MUSC